MKAFIKAISYYLPEKVLTNEQLLAEFPMWSVEKVAAKTGIKERHISATDQTAGDMAEMAAINLFEEYHISPNDIDFVLLCTQSPDYFFPTTACILQDKLGISTRSGAMDFNLGCSGYVYGLSIAKGLIFSRTARNILLLTSETYSKRLYHKDKSNRTIFGDGASATLVSTDGLAEILNFSLGTDGSGAENLIIKTGAFRNPNLKNDVCFDDAGNPVSSDHLYMNGLEIFNFTLKNVPTFVEDTLKKNALSRDDISLFVFHQANKYLMDFLRKKIRIEEEKFFYYIEKVGNTVSSTIPIALKEVQKENKFFGNILLAGFGVGYSWGGVVLNCNNYKH